MRKLIYCFSALLACLGLYSGSVQSQAAVGLVWEEMGPNNMGDHTRAIAVAPNGTVYAGSAGGGLWQSADGGFSWTQVAGLSDNLVVSSIAVEGNNIYVGTGESFFYRPNSSFFSSWNFSNVTTVKAGFNYYVNPPGEGVFVSNDNGATWSHNNGTWGSGSTRFDDVFMSIQKVAVNNGRILVATLEGLYYSDDANLANVTKATGTAYFMGNPIVDIEFGDNGRVFVATKDSVYRSSDNGASFGAAFNADIPVEVSPPNNRVGGDRIEFAVSPDVPSTVYVTGASNVNGNCTGVWKSVDNGSTWVRKAPFEAGTFIPFRGEGLYNQLLTVIPGNPDAFLIGGANLYQFSETNGLIQAASSNNIPGFTTDYVPSPILSIAHDATDDSTWYIGTDNEIVKTTDGGETYSIKTKAYNAANTIGVSASTQYKVVGSERYHGLIFKWNSSSDPNYQQFDDIFPNYNGIGRYSLVRPEIIIAQGTDNGLVRSFDDGGVFESFYGVPIEPIHPSLGTDSIFIDRANSTSGGAGVYDAPGPPVVAWALDEIIDDASLGNDSLINATPNWIYMCSRHFVWVCTNPFGTINTTGIPNWNRITPDLINDVASPREYFTAIEVSGDNNHVVVVGTNYGRIYRIYDANDPLNMDISTKLVRIDDAGNTMPERWITDFAFDPVDPNNLIVTYGGYESSDPGRVWVSNNALTTTGSVAFRDVTGNIENIPVYTAAFHRDPTNPAIMIGTEDGLFTTTDSYSATSFTWNKESDGFGNVPVTDIYVRPFYSYSDGNDGYKYAKDYTVFISTGGRGLWKSSSIVSRPDPKEASAFEATVYPNPSTNHATVEFDLPISSDVRIEVWSLDGRKVDVITDRRHSAGVHKLGVNTQDLQAGIYLVKVNVANTNGQYAKTIKTVVAK